MLKSEVIADPRKLMNRAFKKLKQRKRTYVPEIMYLNALGLIEEFTEADQLTCPIESPGDWIGRLEAEFDSFVYAKPLNVGRGVIHLYTEVLAAWAAGVRDVGIDFFLLCIFFRLGVMPQSIAEIVGDNVRLRSNRKAAKRLGTEFDVTVRLSHAGRYTLCPGAEKWAT